MARRTKLGNCAVCLTPTPAVTEEEIAFGAGRYLVPMCDAHADEMLDQFFRWARHGRLVEERDGATIQPTASYSSTPRRRGRLLRRVEPKLELPRIIVTDEEPEQSEPAPPTTPRRDPKLINADRWIFTAHAESRGNERTNIAKRVDLSPVTKEDVLWCVEHPEIVRPSEEDPNREVRIRAHVQVVVNPHTFEILTVIDRRVTKTQEEELQNA